MLPLVVCCSFYFNFLNYCRIKYYAGELHFNYIDVACHEVELRNLTLPMSNESMTPL